MVHDFSQLGSVGSGFVQGSKTETKVAPFKVVIDAPESPISISVSTELVAVLLVIGFAGELGQLTAKSAGDNKLNNANLTPIFKMNK